MALYQAEIEVDACEFQTNLREDDGSHSSGIYRVLVSLSPLHYSKDLLRCLKSTI
jgi:hypothetical protein